jgi:hypothetical protein
MYALLDRFKIEGLVSGVVHVRRLGSMWMKLPGKREYSRIPVILSRV